MYAIRSYYGRIILRNVISKKKKFIISIAAVFIVAIGIIAFAAADRFLIEHVEIDLNNISSTQTPDVENTSSAADETYTATDMSYTSESKKINITKVVTGTGSSQNTYFVADVILSSYNFV